MRTKPEDPRFAAEYDEMFNAISDAIASRTPCPEMVYGTYCALLTSVAHIQSDLSGIRFNQELVTRMIRAARAAMDQEIGRWIVERN